MSGIKHLLEYAALRGLCAVLGLLPYPVALGVAWAAARLTFHGLRFRRRETLRRIRSVLGEDVGRREADRMAWQSLRNTFFSGVEQMRAQRLRAGWMRRHVRGQAEAIAALRRLIAEHGGAVVAMPHTGNWEIAGLAAGREGVKICTVAGLQRNPLINAWLNNRRGQGVVVLQRGADNLRPVVRLLRHGAALALLPDVRMREPDLAIPFLGGTANVGRGMALFARVAKVPILPIVLRREGWRQHHFEILPPLFPDTALDKETDLRRMTSQVLAAFDAAIRADPGQWFWYNKRWVLEPLSPAAPAAAPAPSGE